MRTLTRDSGREFKITSEAATLTYLIIMDDTIYRTTEMSVEEFDDAEYWTGNDWADFLKKGDYYLVK
ncbi:MAG: hypothetical protein PHS04_16620 [Tissierellia bacterium]|nr:hypothetical protein [Tissierellia bacterium]